MTMLTFTVAALTMAADVPDARSLLDNALMAFGATALAVLTWGLKVAADYLAARVKNARWSGIISRVDDTAIRVVRDVEASYVADLEKAAVDGVVTIEEKAAAKAKALEALKSYLGTKGLGELAKLLGTDSLDGFLGATIEHALENHDNAKAAASGPSVPSPANG